MNPSQLWTVKEATPVRDQDAIDADGQELVAAIALPAVTVGQQVQQLMSAWLKDAQRHRRQTITLPPEGILLHPLDVIDWTSTRNGYVGKAFEIGQVGIDPQTLCTTLSMREVDPNDYNWTVGNEIAVDAPSIDPVEPSAQSVPGFTAAAISITDAASNGRRPAIRMNWSTPLPGVTAMQMQVRVKATGSLVFNGSSEEIDSGAYRLAAGVLPETTYQCRARLKTGKKTTWTDWAAAEVTTGAQYTDTADLAGQAVTVQARVTRTEKVSLTNTTTWKRLAAVTVRRTAGKQTRFEISFSMTGAGTSACNVRILRGSTTAGPIRRITSAPNGSQDQKSYTHWDENTAGGTTTYYLEAKGGLVQNVMRRSDIWNVELLAEQVKR